MSFGILCRQKICRAYAAFRYTWPGSDESFICEHCAIKLKGVASAIGMHLQLIPLKPIDHEGTEGMKSPGDQGK